MRTCGLPGQVMVLLVRSKLDPSNRELNIVVSDDQCNNDNCTINVPKSNCGRIILVIAWMSPTARNSGDICNSGPLTHLLMTSDDLEGG